MESKSAPLSPDRRIAALAASQHGIVSVAQLLAAGLGRGAVAHRVREGRLHRVHRGVYAVGHAPLSQEAGWLAATLACGHGAVLSHCSAAALWELRPSSATIIDVTVPSRAGRVPRPGMRIHRPRVLAEADRTRHRDIPVTSLPRTLLDLGAILSPASLARVVERAETLRLFDLGATLATLTRHPAHRGRGRLESALAAYRADVLTRSELEAAFLALCTDHGVPQPAVNTLLHGHEVDFLWRARRVLAETDGRAYHATSNAFERDRARDAQLMVAGYRVVRFTSRQVLHEPAGVARTLRALLR